MSAPTLTLARLAWRQMSARWASYVPTAVGLAAALALGVAVTLTQARTDETSLVRAVNGLGAQGLVSVRLTGVRQVDAYRQFQAAVQQAASREQGLVTPRSTLLYSGVYSPSTVNGVVQTTAPLEIAVFEDLQSHVQLTAGSWPVSAPGTKPIEATLSEDAASAAHLKVGDTQCMHVLSPGTYSVCVHVAGIWKPLNRTDSYWGPDQAPPIAAFTDDATYFAIVGAEAGGEVPQLVSVATVTLAPDLNAIRSAGADDSLTRLRRLHAEFGVARPDAVVISNLETALDQYVNERSVASFAVQLVAVQLLLIALYCVWLLAGTLLAQQSQIVAVWRSRGWSWPGVGWLLWLELLVVALIAIPLGVAGGWVASEVVSRFAYSGQSIPSFHLDWGRLAPPVAAILVVELALLAGRAALASRHGVIATRGESSRPATPWWRQRYVDLALAVLAVPLLAEVSFVGNASVRAAGLVNDPTTLVLPGVAVALLALAALRLLPLVVRLVARVRGSMSARLASMQLLRAPGQHAGLAILLMLAVALGVFASTYIATAQRNGADRAAYQAGADVRGTFGGAVTVLPDAIPVMGAAARSSVFRGYAREANEDVSMIAVDPYSFAPVINSRADLASTPLPDLVQRLADRETGSRLLPVGTSTLSIWVHGSNTGGTLTAHFSDEHGRPGHANLGALDFADWRQLSGRVVADGPPLTSQVRFRDLAISGVTSAGEIALSSFEVGSAEFDSFAEDVQGVRGERGLPFLWWRSDWDTGALAESLAPSMAVPRNGSRTIHFRVVPAHIPTYIRAPRPFVFNGNRAVPAGAIPALVSPEMLTRFGLSVGDQMHVEVDHIGFSAVIVGVADHFPTLYPELGDFMVLDRDPLLIELAFGGHQRPWPNEV